MPLLYCMTFGFPYGIETHEHHGDFKECESCSRQPLAKNQSYA